MKRRAMLLGLAALALAVGFGLAGCRRSPTEKRQIVIGLTVPSLSHPFFICIKKHVADEAAKLGVRLIAADAEDVAAKQMAIVEDFIAQGVDGVVMAPIGSAALVPAVEALSRAGIPLATVDRKVEGGDVLVHVGGDNVEGGRIAARYILQKLGGKGAVIGAGAGGAAGVGAEEVTKGQRVKVPSETRLTFVLDTSIRI